MGARSRPRGHRHSGRRGEAPASDAGSVAPRLKQGGIRVTGVAMESGKGRGDSRSAENTGRQPRLGPGIFHRRRGACEISAELNIAAISSWINLSRERYVMRSIAARR